MTGHKPFKILSDKLLSTPEGRAAVEREGRLTEAILHLTRLREAHGATQQQIADAWEATQANVSQIEHTPDIFLSTLHRYVEALGGRLEIRAVFPDETIDLTPPETSPRRARTSPEERRPLDGYGTVPFGGQATG